MSHLLVKAVTGILTLLLVLALALFLPAGSWHFWQAWVYLVVFAVCLLLLALYLARCDTMLLANRVKFGPTTETQKHQKIIIGLVNLFFLGLFLIPGLDYRFHWSAVPPVVSWLAVGCVALSQGIIFLVFRENHYTSA